MTSNSKTIVDIAAIGPDLIEALDMAVKAAERANDDLDGLQPPAPLLRYEKSDVVTLTVAPVTITIGGYPRYSSPADKGGYRPDGCRIDSYLLPSQILGLLDNVRAVEADLRTRIVTRQGEIDRAVADALAAEDGAIKRAIQETIAVREARERERAAEAERTQRAEDERAKRRAAEHAAEAERAAWIEAHGSDRLKRMAAAKIEHDATYRDERLALDRPDWKWGDNFCGDGQKYQLDDPRNPPIEALDLLDAARTTDPAAELQYYRLYDHLPDDDDADKDGDVVVERGYVCAALFLGHQIVTKMKVPVSN